MKKIFSLVAIAAVAATMFTSCKDDKPGPIDNKKAKLTLSADKLTLDVAAKGEFKIASDIAAPEAIVISVTSSDDKILTVDPASVTIAKDGKEIKGTYTGVANGKAKIKIATTTPNVSVIVAEVEITVGNEGPALEELLECNADAAWSNTFFANENSMGFTLWYNTSVVLENGGCAYYGTNLVLTAAEKGTDIAGLTMTSNPEHIYMGTNATQGYEFLPDFSAIDGTKYVVFCVADGFEAEFDDQGTVTNPEALTHDKPQKKGWALVTVKGGSVVLNAFKFPATKVGE